MKHLAVLKIQTQLSGLISLKMNIQLQQNRNHAHSHPSSHSPLTPTSDVLYDALLPNKLLWCLESIRSNIPLLKTSWLILGEWSKETVSRGRGGPQISISIKGRRRGFQPREQERRRTVYRPIVKWQKRRYEWGWLVIMYSSIVWLHIIMSFLSEKNIKVTLNSKHTRLTRVIELLLYI